MALVTRKTLVNLYKYTIFHVFFWSLEILEILEILDFWAFETRESRIFKNRKFCDPLSQGSFIKWFLRNKNRKLGELICGTPCMSHISKLQSTNIRILVHSFNQIYFHHVFVRKAGVCCGQFFGFAPAWQPMREKIKNFTTSIWNLFKAAVFFFFFFR